MGSQRRCTKPGLGVIQGGFSEEGTNRHLRPFQLFSDSYQMVQVSRCCLQSSSHFFPVPQSTFNRICSPPTSFLCFNLLLHPLTSEGQQNMPPQNMTLWYILSCRHLKNSKCRERLSRNPPYLPKDRSSSGCIVIDSPPQEFHQPEKTVYPQRGD